MLTVNVLVNVLDALDAAGGLDIEMTPVFAEEVRVVGNDPTAVDVFIELVVAFDPRKDGPMFWSLILRIAVGLDFRLFAEREWVLLGALSAKLWRVHTGAIGIESAAGSVKHVESNESMKLWIDGFIRNLTRHNFVDVLGGPRFVAGVLEDQQDMRMWQSALLQKKGAGQWEVAPRDGE